MVSNEQVCTYRARLATLELITRLGGYDVQQRQVPGLGKHNLELLTNDGDEAGKTRDGVKVAVRPPPLDSQRVECAPTAGAGF